MVTRFEKFKFTLMLKAVGFYKHMTLGARTAVIVDGSVLLVRHGYIGGWQLPGGGVDPGETAEQAARREVLEETGYCVSGPMRLVGLYHSQIFTNRDHVAFFAAEAAERSHEFVANREIAEIGWFGLNELPEGVSPATQRRLDEMSGRNPIVPEW